jgi:hypothetical protein
MITSDVRSGKCQICMQGGENGIPVLELEPASGMRVWGLAVCRKCATELKRHLDEFLSPRDPD